MRHLDPAAALTLLLASVFGQQMSTVIGPYAVIILAATTQLLTPEIKSAWIAKLQANFFLVP